MLSKFPNNNNRYLVFIPTLVSLPVCNLLNNYECRFLPSSCLLLLPSPLPLNRVQRVLAQTRIDRVAMPDSMSSRRGSSLLPCANKPRSGNAFSSANVLISAIEGIEGGHVQLKSCRISGEESGDGGNATSQSKICPGRVARAEC